VNDPQQADPAAWQRLPSRLLLVRATPSLLALVPIGLAFLLLGRVPGQGVFLAIFAAVLFGLVRDLARIASTRVRVGQERVELRSGIITTSHRSVPRDRVRTVDVTASLLQRIAGLAVVRIGTGEQARGDDSGDLELDALDAHVAYELQHHLLHRADALAEPVGDDSGAGQGELLAALRWRWMPWSIVSWWTIALPAILVGSLLQLANAAGIDQPLDEQATRDLARDAMSIGAMALLLFGAGAFLLIGVLARCASFVETWWAFELRRDRQAGQLRARRGLLTTRATSLLLARIRGVELREPLLLRPWRVCHAGVVTTGLADRGESAERGGSTALGPSAPRHEVEAIAASVLDVPASPTAAQLHRHPPAARTRRLVRAGAAAVVVGTLAGLATFDLRVAGVVTTAVLVITLPAALDLYRSLGHARSGRWLVVRRGSLLRRTTALEVDGIVGWVGRRTFFQRRAGLMTLLATTAAGNGAYAIIDAAPEDCIAVADEATPELLAPFTIRS
jgi:putative membrane protein